MRRITAQRSGLTRADPVRREGTQGREPQGNPTLKRFSGCVRCLGNQGTGRQLLSFRVSTGEADHTGLPLGLPPGPATDLAQLSSPACVHSWVHRVEVQSSGDSSRLPAKSWVPTGSTPGSAPGFSGVQRFANNHNETAQTTSSVNKVCSQWQVQSALCNASSSSQQASVSTTTSSINNNIATPQRGAALTCTQTCSSVWTPVRFVCYTAEMCETFRLCETGLRTTSHTLVNVRDVGFHA